MARPTMTSERRTMIALDAEGVSHHAIGKRLGRSPMTVSRIVGRKRVSRVPQRHGADMATLVNRARHLERLFTACNRVLASRPF